MKFFSKLGLFCVLFFLFINVAEYSLCFQKSIYASNLSYQKNNYLSDKKNDIPTPQFAFLRFKYEELDINFAKPGDSVRFCLNFTFHPEDWDVRKDYPFQFELNYTYSDQNGYVRSKCINTNNGQLVFFVPIKYLQVDDFTIFMDFHLYVYFTGFKTEYRLFPQLRQYHFNWAQFTKLHNIILKKDFESYDLKLPYKCHFDSNQKFFVDSCFAILRFIALFDDLPYLEIKNFKIIFISNYLSIDKCSFFINKENIINLIGANFNQLDVDFILMVMKYI